MDEVVPDCLPIRVNEKVIIRKLAASPLSNFLAKRRVARSAVVCRHQFIEPLLLAPVLSLMLPVPINRLSICANEYALYKLALDGFLFRDAPLEFFGESIDLATKLTTIEVTGIGRES